MPRFVILEHDHPILHWDLMLQSGETLRTWRLDCPPAPGRVIAATPLADHRLMYLDYEGEVSGGRGRVVRWDSGSFTWVSQDVERLELRLLGIRLVGRVYLCRDASGAWSFALTSGEPSDDAFADRCDAPAADRPAR